MIQTCAGCGNVAFRFARYNDGITLCNHCALLMPSIQTRPITKKGKLVCLGCDSVVYHGITTCSFCVDDAIRWTIGNLGLEGLDNNPTLYQLILPHIIFKMRLNSDFVTADPNWWRFFLWNDGNNSVWHEIDFSGLANSIEEMS